MEASTQQALLQATFHVNAPTRQDALSSAAELSDRLQALCLTLQGRCSIDISLQLQPPPADRDDRA